MISAGELRMLRLFEFSEHRVEALFLSDIPLLVLMHVAVSTQQDGFHTGTLCTAVQRIWPRSGNKVFVLLYFMLRTPVQHTVLVCRVVMAGFQRSKRGLRCGESILRSLCRHGLQNELQIRREIRPEVAERMRLCGEFFERLRRN